MITIAYIGLLIVAALCIGIVIYEHKKCKQKDIDTELYNQNLQTTKGYLEGEVKRLTEQIEERKLFNQQILEEKDNLLNDQKILNKIINELNQQQQKCKIELTENQALNKSLRLQTDDLIAQMETLQRSIEDLTNSQKAAARASFEQYCDTLDYEYKQKESEYDNLIQLLQSVYDDQMKRLQVIFKNEETMYKDDIAVIKQELEKIRATRAAAMEAELREQEIKNQATFYTLQLNEADMRDVSYLKSIEFNLREARPLRMLIWTTFYRDKVNELAARVGAVGACGIYKITHIETGISYIGQAKDIKDRWVAHVKCSLGIDTPVTSQLYAFTREKGIDNFTFEILEKCSANELNEKEKFYIDLYQTYDYGLNKTRGNG